MNTKHTFVITLLAACGLFSGQCLAHGWSIPHTHMGMAMTAILALLAGVLTVSVLVKSKRNKN